MERPGRDPKLGTVARDSRDSGLADPLAPGDAFHERRRCLSYRERSRDHPVGDFYLEIAGERVFVTSDSAMEDRP